MTYAYAWQVCVNIELKYIIADCLSEEIEITPKKTTNTQYERVVFGVCVFNMFIIWCHKGVMLTNKWT